MSERGSISYDPNFKYMDNIVRIDEKLLYMTKKPMLLHTRKGKNFLLEMKYL